VRLLPNSASARFPDGLANSSGLVGKNLMFHPRARIAGWFDQMLDGYRGLAELHMEPGILRDGPRPRVRARLHLGILSRPGDGGVNGMQIGRLSWGAEHHRAYRRLSCHRTGMVAICEDLPEEHNTVTLVPC
jgi:hypothetical protein